jgi:hypothetical protein
MGKFAPKVVEFLNKEEREDWAAKKVKFNIMAVKDVTGKYGKNFDYLLETIDKDKTQRKFSLVYESARTGLTNTRRVEEAEFIATEIQTDGFCGPCILSKFETSEANEAWGFASAE